MRNFPNKKTITQNLATVYPVFLPGTKFCDVGRETTLSLDLDRYESEIGTREHCETTTHRKNSHFLIHISTDGLHREARTTNTHVLMLSINNDADPHPPEYVMSANFCNNNLLCPSREY